MSNQEGGNNNNNGSGFVGQLTILFIGLKLTGYIDWPWIWVLSPLWIYIALILSLVGVVLLVAVAYEACRRRKT